MKQLNNYIDRRAGVARNNARYFAFVIKITRHINAQNLTQSILAIKTCDAGQHNNKIEYEAIERNAYEGQTVGPFVFSLIIDSSLYE